MPLPAPTIPAPPAATARAAAWQRIQRHAGRTLAYMVVLCVSIALLLFAIERRSFGTKLVFSFSIALGCLSASHGARLAWAAFDDWRRRSRGQPPGPGRFAAGWHGTVPTVLVGMLIDPQVFRQVHRGTLVQARAIGMARRDESGKAHLCLRGRPETLVASRLYAHLFKGM